MKHSPVPTSPTRPEQGSPGTRGPIPPTLLTKAFSLTTCLDSLSLNLRCNVIARRRKEGLNVKKEKITFFPKQSLVSAPRPAPQTGLRHLFSADSLRYPDHPLSPCPQSGHFHVGRRQSKPLGEARKHSLRKTWNLPSLVWQPHSQFWSNWKCHKFSRNCTLPL